MKLSAHKFAIAVWIGAAFIVVSEWLFYFPSIDLTTTPSIEQFISMVGRSALYGGGLAALGAIVQLLGEIRDQLTAKS